MKERDIVKDVYENLKESTERLSKKTKEYEELKALEKSGIYSDHYIKGTLRPKMEGLKRSIEKERAEAISNAKNLVNEYKEELRDSDNLHPEALTEDAKLFKAGVKLSARDLEAILSRNEGNATMEQLTLRYAEENGVDLGKRLYIGHQAEIQNAENVNGAIATYEKWIDKDNAGEVLEQMFKEPATW